MLSQSIRTKDKIKYLKLKVRAIKLGLCVSCGKTNDRELLTCSKCYQKKKFYKQEKLRILKSKIEAHRNK